MLDSLCCPVRLAARFVDESGQETDVPRRVRYLGFVLATVEGRSYRAITVSASQAQQHSSRTVFLAADE